MPADSVRRGSTTTNRPPRARRASTRLETGRAHQGSTGSNRVAADADEQLRPVDIGYGHQELVPEHHAGSHHVRELVHAGGRVEILSANGADEVANRQHRAEVVHRRVTDVKRHGIVAVACSHLTDAPLISSNAASQDVSSHPEDVRRIGRRRRSGSSWRSFSATAFGQMWPRLSTSSRSGLIDRTCPSRCSITMPHMASQIEHVR